MSLNPQKPTDFLLPVPGVGEFRFNRRTYGSNIKISATAARILGPAGSEEEADPVMLMHAQLVGLYSALVSACPAGWEDLESMDLTSHPEREEQILLVYIELKKKLDSFRVTPGQSAADQASQGASAGAAPDGGVLGAQQVPAAAHGPEVAGA